MQGNSYINLLVVAAYFNHTIRLFPHPSSSFKRSGNEDEHLSLQLVGAEIRTSQLFIVSPFNPAFPMNNLPLEMI